MSTNSVTNGPPRQWDPSRPAPASRLRQVALRALHHLLLSSIGLLFMLPFAWSIATSLKTPAEMFEVTPHFLPAQPRWRNYRDVLEAVPFARFYLNSILVTAGRVAGQLLFCSMAAFAFARLRFPGRNALFFLLLCALMVPSQVTLIPNYILMQKLHWLDTYTGLIVPSLFSAYGVFLLRQSFLTIPQELHEAAVIEGANPFQIYWWVCLPLVRPAMVAFGLLVTLWSWNDFLWPLIITSRTDMQVLPMGIALFQGQFTTNTALMMAAATMATLPMVGLFLLVQRSIIGGIALSGMK
jgi:multiple sugar transport system permease protein